MAYTTIDDPTLYFSATLYTGDGQQDRAVTIDGTGMQPDLLWNKSRSLGEQHAIGDSVRGVQRKIGSSNNDAQSSAGSYTNFSTITSTGFTVATGGVDGAVNQNNATYCNWAWKETATAGFDIVLYTGNATGRTIAHNLNAVPKMIITKNVSASGDWYTYHQAVGNTKPMLLNQTNAASDADASFWNNTSPTSSVFSVGGATAVNGNGNSIIAYVFAEKQGYSKFGSYVGNGNANGTFVYTGFKPAFVMTKSSETTSNWEIKDNKRLGYNQVDTYIKANAGAAEDTGVSSHAMDFLSNGFKHRGNNDEVNGSGEAYIYMAFAESPFVSSSSVPTTAR